MRFFLDISFDGTEYSGWQRQPKDKSVQQCLEEALSVVFQQNIEVVGAGRTDAGVHASQMIAHADLPDGTETEVLKRKLNMLLPADISVNSIVRVRENAHARFDAVSRRYRYYVSLSKNPFERKYCMRMFSMPDVELMNKAASLLLNVTDFTSFAKLHSDTKTNICHVTRAEWNILPDGRLEFVIEADRFLRNMVRAIVGTLLQLGRGKINLEQFVQIIESKDRCCAGDSVPASGLFLDKVQYSESVFFETESVENE